MFDWREGENPALDCCDKALDKTVTRYKMSCRRALLGLLTGEWRQMYGLTSVRPLGWRCTVIREVHAEKAVMQAVTAADEWYAEH